MEYKIPELKYTYNDISIVPVACSKISSRSECNPLYEDGKLPLFTAPMSSVIDLSNIELFEQNGIHTIIPRTVDIKERIEYVKYNFIAVSLNEFVEIVNNNKDDVTPLYICIDIANGHMKDLHDAISNAKVQFPNMVIMAGNVASPDGYEALSLAGCDYVRVGIGGGHACILDGTKILMLDGSEKNIENIQIGDIVKTLEGYNKVTSTFRFESDSIILEINDEIKCTDDHKFFVINKTDKHLVNESNIKQFGKWIEAKNLDKNKHLLIKID